jgi:hypothetical protein
MGWVGSNNLGMLILYTLRLIGIVLSTGFGQIQLLHCGRYKICLTYLFTSANSEF